MTNRRRCYDDDDRNPETISNRNEAIVALRGDDGLFWIFFQSVKVFEQEDKPKPRRGCEDTGGGMIVAGLGCCLYYHRQQQAATLNKRQWKI